MSVEPGILDANVLAYAINADAPQHEASRALLEAARDPSIALYVTSQILCEFYSLITNPRRVTVASSPTEALRIMSALLALPGLRVLPDSGPRGRGMDGTPAALPRYWWRRVRFANCSDHAGQWRSANLHLQYR